MASKNHAGVPSHFDVEVPDFLSNDLMKPTMDTIYAEVERSLPSIDFEISDVSSEEDVPIFHRALKTPTNEDDDYYADSFLEETTSRIDEYTVSGFNNNNAEDKGNQSKQSKGAFAEFDIGSAASKMLSELNLDPQSDALSLIAANLVENAKADRLVPTKEPGVPAILRNTWVSDQTSLDVAESPVVPSPSGSPRNGKRIEVPELSPNLSKSGHRKTKEKKSGKGDGVGVVSKYLPEQAPTLALDNIDIDQLVDVTLGRIADGTTSLTETSFTEEVRESSSSSLIQRLAHLSMAQSGTELQGVDPCSGALKKSRTRGLKDMKTARNMHVSVSLEGLDTAGDSTGSVPKDLPNLPRSRLTPSPPSRKKEEPETVFLDLRRFEDTQKEQKSSIERVQRVLGITQEQSQSSDSSEDEEDAVMWHEQRKQIKQALQLRGSQSDDVLMRQTKDKALSTCPPTQSRTHTQKVSLPKKVEAPIMPSSGSNSHDTDVTIPAVKQSADSEQLERSKKLEAAKKLREQRESERQSRIRLGKRLEAVKPTTSDRGHSPCAEATPILFDIEASYEPAPLTLPYELSNDLELVLLSVVLASNGEMVGHRGAAHKSVDSGLGLSASYTTLITWLLSLVPDRFDFLQCVPDIPILSHAPFHVIGLQQMYIGGELKLYIAVTPVERFSPKSAPGKPKPKTKKRDELKDSSPFQQILTKYFSVNTLHSVCPWLQDMTSMEVTKGNQGYTEGEFVYRPPLPNITSRPLSTFIQINPDGQASYKVFRNPVGFFWQTVESDELCYDHDLNERGLDFDTQNTMSLIYKRVYREPCAMMGILNRVLQEGFDLSGLRLLYPTPDLLNMTSKTPNLSAMEGQNSMEMLNHIGPITALAIRGTHARGSWLDAVGPSDPALARKTDPTSLCALYGGDSRDECLLFCPRNPDRIFSELSRWFGGRVPPSGVIDVGRTSGKERVGSGGKKGRKGPGTDDILDGIPLKQPAAMLSSVTRSDIFVVVSPLVPIKCLGLLLATCQRRGYQLHGIRRSNLSVKRASSLGLNGTALSVFSGEQALKPDSNGDAGLFVPVARQPSTLLLLNKENALHSAASLVEAFTVQLSLQGILGEIADSIQLDSDVVLTSALLFHATPYAEGVLNTLGGDFSKVPDTDLTATPEYVTPQLHTNPELEQIITLTLTGHQLLKKFGLFIGRLLGVVPYSKNPAPSSLDRGLELLGIKWLPSLSLRHAKELTPYEVGDQAWKPSLQKLTSEPAVVVALRGVNAFKVVEHFIALRSSQGTSLYHGNTSPNSRLTLETIMSPTPEMAYHQARLFFLDRELHADMAARWMLKYLYEPQEMQSTKSKTQSKDQQLPATMYSESILKTMLSGPRPITTLLLCKPDVVKRSLGKLLRRVVQEGFLVVAMRLIVLSEDDALVAVPTEDQEDDILRKMHVEYLTSSPSLVICLQRENAVKKLCDVIGPPEPKQARRVSSSLWRGVFGSDPICNGLHASCDYQEAISELERFFPDGLCCKKPQGAQNEQPYPGKDTIADLGQYRQRSVANTDPSIALGDHTYPQPATRSSGTSSKTHTLPVTALTQTNCLVFTPLMFHHEPRSKRMPFVEVLEYLLTKGFELVGGRMLWFNEEQAQNFLHINDAGSFAMVPLLRSGPSLILAVQRDNAVMALDSLLGSSFQKDSILCRYGDKILRAKDVEHANRLLAYFFSALIPAAHAQISTKS